MGEIEVERVIAVDWSGDKGPGQKKKIWAGVWTAATGQVKLESGRSREELIAWLVDMARQTPRMVVGLDCCFSFPSWFLREHNCSNVFEFWDHVASGQGERWLAREHDEIARDRRFWGAPHKRPPEFSGEGLVLSMRQTDMDNKITPRRPGGDAARSALMKGITAKSPFQIGGSGSVGTGSIRAMPLLSRLRAAGFRIWPFEDAQLDSVIAAPLLVEMYTRLLTGPVRKSNLLARRDYLRRATETNPLYQTLPRGTVHKAQGSEDAFDALVCTLEMVRNRRDFPSLRRTEEPELKLEGITWRPGLSPADYGAEDYG